jgi:ubiquinone/menaquinone biosynthesis C-methylase UbiE
MFKPEFEDNYKIIKGIYSFVNDTGLSDNNLKYSKLYSKKFCHYNLSQKFKFWMQFGNEFQFREQFLNELNINDKNKVLEISVGTADNFKFLNPEAEYYGVDINLAKLKKAKRHCNHLKINATFIHSESENLPFPDNYFDSVYFCGGIDFLNDKEKSISEMIRVAKPGIRLLIVGETDKLIRSNFQKNPFIKINPDDAEKMKIPINLVPKDMINITFDIVCDGTVYKLMFTKPYYKAQKINRQS